jgi:hypothetical protein
MGKTIRIFGLLCFMLGLVAVSFAEDAGDESWHKKIASPSYGLNIGFFTLDYEDELGESQTKTLVMPGIELRHFNGINVPRDGGFYYGYELGIGVNFYIGEHRFNDNGIAHTVEDIMAASGLAMVKHGYRFGPGKGNNRPSFGLELGMGITAGGGSVTITRDEDEWGENIAATLDEPIGPVFELGFEGALHRGDDHRFVVRLGIMGGPPPLATENFGEMAAVRISLRGGFTMNH